MKKILYVFCAVLVLSLCGLGTYLYSGTAPVRNLDGTYTFTINLKLSSPENDWKENPRSYVRRYIMEMYEGGIGGQLVQQSNSMGQFKVNIKEDVEYICLFWADDGTTYDATNLKAIRQINEADKGTPAYYARTEINVKDVNKEVDLKLAVAKIGFADRNGLINNENTLTVTYPYANSSFNVSEGLVDRNAGITERVISNIGTCAASEVFASDYIFASAEGETLNALKFKFNDEQEKIIDATAIQAKFSTKINNRFWTQSYKVGDVYPSTIAPLGVVFWVDPNDATYNKEELSGKKGLIVSLKEYSDTRSLTSVWSTEDAVVGAKDSDNGRANMQAVSEYIKESGKSWDQYPVFKWVQATMNRKKGNSLSWNKDTDRWYIPSKKELEKLYAGFSGKKYEDIKGWDGRRSMPHHNSEDSKVARKKFNASLIGAGGSKLETSSLTAYWSSTEMSFNTVCFIVLHRGHLNYSNKILSARTRAVSSF